MGEAHPVAFVLYLLILLYAILIPFVVLKTKTDLLRFGSGQQAYFASYNVLIRLFLLLIFAPLIETALLQWAPIRLLHTKFKVSWPVTIFASAGIFASVHNYSFGMIIFGFLAGLVLAYGFAARDDGKGSSFWLVTIVHSLRNVVPAILLS